MEIKQLLDKKV